MKTSIIRLAGPLAVAAAIGLLTTGATAPQDAPGLDVPGTREAMKQWVENNRQIARARADWQVEQEVLRDRIDLMKAEIERSRAATAEAQEGIAQLGAELDELVDDDERLTAATEVLESTVADVERRLKALLPLLPEPLVAQVEMLSKRLPDDPATTDVKLSARYITAAGIIQLVDRFNQEVKTDSSVVVLGDGTNASVSTLHLGLGQAYYVTPNGDAAGIGRVTPEGWRWTPADAHAQEILEAIAIVNGEKGPGYVLLPVSID